jgi:N-acyl-D-amino-acid deacylase
MLDPGRVEAASRVLIAWSAAHPALAGEDLDGIARRWRCTRRQAAERLTPGGAVYFTMDAEDVRAIVTHPLAMIGSDGLPHDVAPHPRLWGTFARVLGPLVRDAGWFPLERAVQKMTGLTAERFGLAGRGRIEVGAWADLVVLDPAGITDRATYESPRLPPQGIDCVIVNGVLRVRDGSIIAPANGRLL